MYGNRAHIDLHKELISGSIQITPTVSRVDNRYIIPFFDGPGVGEMIFLRIFAGFYAQGIMLNH